MDSGVDYSLGGTVMLVANVLGRSITILSALIILVGPIVVLAQVPGDFDGDGVITLNDHTFFPICMSGPSGVLGVGCSVYDFNTDLRIDLRDAAGFAEVFNPPICGNGLVEPGETCETDAGCPLGGTCDPTLCQCRGDSNDDCANPAVVGDGETVFNTTGATTDGPTVSVTCDALQSSDQIESDVWFCYTATCDGEVVASLCGSSYDTKMAVYSGCACPTTPLITCSDDDCSSARSDSRVVFPATVGQSYMIRVGGFAGEMGVGRLNIRCGVEPCGTGGDCLAAHPEPGCDDAACCALACDLDAFCCDVMWDDFCAGVGQGVCNGNFDACQVSTDDCTQQQTTGGCGDVDCCNSVCLEDPFCCLDTWDDLCAFQARGQCALSCGPTSGNCLLPNGSPGCDNVPCCQTVCNNDPFCCNTTWDQGCVDTAAIICQ